MVSFDFCFKIRFFLVFTKCECSHYSRNGNREWLIFFGIWRNCRSAALFLLTNYHQVTVGHQNSQYFCVLKLICIEYKVQLPPPPLETKEKNMFVYIVQSHILPSESVHFFVTQTNFFLLKFHDSIKKNVEKISHLFLTFFVAVFCVTFLSLSLVIFLF